MVLGSDGGVAVGREVLDHVGGDPGDAGDVGWAQIGVLVGAHARVGEHIRRGRSRKRPVVLGELTQVLVVRVGLVLAVSLTERRRGGQQPLGRHVSGVGRPMRCGTFCGVGVRVDSAPEHLQFGWAGGVGMVDCVFQRRLSDAGGYSSAQVRPRVARRAAPSADAELQPLRVCPAGRRVLPARSATLWLRGRSRVPRPSGCGGRPMLRRFGRGNRSGAVGGTGR